MLKGAGRFLRRPTDGDRDVITRRDVPQLRRRALLFEADGRIQDAIAVWTQLNRFRPDAATETHLVDLRCDPRNVESDARPAEPWPREFDDPFPDVFGRPPEIGVDELSVELLGGALLHHGSLLVRGLMTTDRARALRETTDRAFAAREQHVQGLPIEQTTPWYVPCAQWDAVDAPMAKSMRRFNDDNKALHVADSPRALFQIIDALRCTKTIEAISEYLGEAPVLSVHKTMLRRVPPDAKPSFHQDGTFMGLQTRAVDIWVAFTKCGGGTDAPGLAILPRRLPTSVRPGAAEPHIPLGADEVEAVCDDVDIVHPTFEPGDALLFDELLLHANGGGQPGLTQYRYALEAWFFAPSAVPGTYLPLLV
jgi:hypothetical protein